MADKWLPEVIGLTRRTAKAKFEEHLEQALELARVAGTIPMNRTAKGDIEQGNLILRYMEKHVIVEADGTDIGDRLADRFAFHVSRIAGYTEVFPSLPKEDRAGPTGGRKPLSEDEKAARLFSDN